jgi:hypothetical protein
LKIIRRFLRSGKCQMGVSLVACISVILVYTALKKGKTTSLVLGNFGAYFGFMVGIGAILILVSSIATALLVYYFQSAKSNETYFYARYREVIADLRTLLDHLHDDGLISRSYDGPYRELESLLVPKELPLAFHDVAMPFLDVVRDELGDRVETEEEFDWAFYSVATRLAVAEETANGLGVNLIQKVVMTVWVRPVLKSFWSLAAVVLSALIGAIYFSGVIVIILNVSLLELAA